jgi:hypothetical protein
MLCSLQEIRLCILMKVSEVLNIKIDERELNDSRIIACWQTDRYREADGHLFASSLLTQQQWQNTLFGRPVFFTPLTLYFIGLNILNIFLTNILILIDPIMCMHITRNRRKLITSFCFGFSSENLIYYYPKIGLSSVPAVCAVRDDGSAILFCYEHRICQLHKFQRPYYRTVFH